MSAIQPYAFQRGGNLDYKDRTCIPADASIRPLRDTLFVLPLDAKMSAIIDVVHEERPLRGIVTSVGPGLYPKRYDHREKHRRTKMYQYQRGFRPTTVKVGDLVELGGREQGGYNFQTVYIGDTMHIICREEDVTGILELPETPAHWQRGALLDVKRFGDGSYKVYLMGETGDQHQWLDFPSAPQCQDFVSWWYARESAPRGTA